MVEIPYRHIASLPDIAARQLSRNFEEAASQLDAGAGQVKVPYKYVTGLPKAAQYQIWRNFEELACNCSDTPPAPGTVITSDEFARGVTLTGPFGYSDAALGGAPLPWTATRGTWVVDPTSGGSGVHQADQVAFTNDFINIDPGVTDYRISAHMNRPASSTAGTIGLVARRVDDNNFVAWMLAKFGATWDLYLFVRTAGVDTLLAGSPIVASPVPSTGFGSNSLALEVIGTTVNGYYDGVLTATGTLAAPFLTPTKAGFLHQSAANGAVYANMTITAA